MIPVAELRRIAASHGLKPKGGFRVQRASAKQLGELLADRLGGDDAVRGELAGLLPTGEPEASGANGPQDGHDERLRAELVRLNLKLEKSEKRAKREQDSAQKARRSLQLAVESRRKNEARIAELTNRSSDLARRYEAVESELARLRKRCAEFEKRDVAREGELLGRRVEELEQAGEESRREIAELSSRNRKLEELTRELESYLPRGQKERLRQLRRESEEPTALLTPFFAEDFLRSLEGFEVETLRRIHVAIAQLVLSGIDYPGLQVKVLKGVKGLHSMRAGIHHRVYFRRDGDLIVFEHAGSREDQPGYLKKLRES